MKICLGNCLQQLKRYELQQLDLFVVFVNLSFDHALLDISYMVVLVI